MTNVIKTIEELLVYTDYEAWEQSNVGGFFVHSSIFKNQIQRVPGISIQNTWDYELQMGDTSYSMKLIFVNADFNGSFRIMWNLCKTADISFPWEENLALYVPVNLCSLLEKFIETEELNHFIDCKTDVQGIISNNETIRIVRFHIRSYTKKEYYKKIFKKFLRAQQISYYPMQFYCSVAFPWLQPWILKKFDIPFRSDNPTYAVIPIILHCTNHLSNNIFDLVAARMAFCDCRNLEPTAFIQSKIDYEIVRTMKDPKYLKNNEFDLDQYVYDKNITINDRIDWLKPYLFYTFQQFIGTSVTEQNQSRLQYKTIKLSENSDALNMLKMKSNLKFNIDGIKFRKMSFKLFNDLAGCHNVNEIILDTNYRLDSNMDGVDQLKFLDTAIDLYLFGNNRHNFIEDFMLCIHKFEFTQFICLRLCLNCELRSYTIFDEFPITILILSDISITTALAEFSTSTKLTTKIVFQNCRLENKRKNWIMLNNFERLALAEIQEEDYTWQSIFDWVEHELYRLGTKEFQVIQHISIISGQTIRLRGHKFGFNADGTKLEIQHPNNEIIDLCYLKFAIEPDEKCDYDFYQ